MGTSVADSVSDEYGRLAAGYDRRWASYIAASADRTLEFLETLPPGERLLDVGCGTGMLLEKLAARAPGARLCGIDLCGEMLAIASARLGVFGATWIRGVAERLPLPDEAFDAVVSNSAFHYFGDPCGALCEMHRVLRPGGRLVLTDWCADFLSCRVLERWLRWRRRPHVRAYTGAECASLLAECGFSAPRVERYRIGWCWGLQTCVGWKRER